MLSNIQWIRDSVSRTCFLKVLMVSHVGMGFEHLVEYEDEGCAVFGMRFVPTCQKG